MIFLLISEIFWKPSEVINSANMQLYCGGGSHLFFYSSLKHFSVFIFCPTFFLNMAVYECNHFKLDDPHRFNESCRFQNCSTLFFSHNVTGNNYTRRNRLTRISKSVCVYNAETQTREHMLVWRTDLSSSCALFTV